MTNIVSRYFSIQELSCRCGCGLLPTPSIQIIADLVREGWGRPVYCVSGARCERHTLSLIASGIDARLGSAHNERLAVDLRPAHLKDIFAFHDYCEQNLGIWGVWMEVRSSTPSWAHLQLRPVLGIRGTRLFLPG